MMFSVLPVNKKDQHNPRQSGRNGHEDDEWIDEGCELGHQDQVDHQHRNDEPNPKLQRTTGSC